MTPADDERRRRRSSCFRVQLARRRWRLLQAAQVHGHGIALGKDVLEAALGQTPVQRHLAAFEALQGNAAARLLALVAACPEVLPVPDPMPRPMRLRALRRALVVGQLDSASSFVGPCFTARAGKSRHQPSLLDPHQVLHLR